MDSRCESSADRVVQQRSDSPKTLLDLDERFGISRERVRQIREIAVSRPQASLSNEPVT